jgi:hypothetical protein
MKQADSETKTIPSELKVWWNNQLKFWLWYCYPQETGEIPQENEYFLHAAVPSVATQDTIHLMSLNY